MILLPSEDFDYSRIVNRKYHDVALDILSYRGWKKNQLAEAAREWVKKNRLNWEVKDVQVYDWLSGDADPHTSFSKLMEFILGVNLPPQCYYNAGKRK